MLAHSGRLMGDLTTMRLGDSHFRIGGSGYLQAWHMRWFDEHLAGGEVTIENVSDEFGGLALVGPRARDLLASISGADVSDRALPFMAVTSLTIASMPVTVARLSVSGELGYELYCAARHLPALYETVIQQGTLSPRPMGLYALNSLRLEKGFGIWSREFSRDYTPRMAGLDRFIAYEKSEFIGREAALRERATVPAKRLVLLDIDCDDADASGYEPLWVGEEFVGFVTSGGYGHCVKKSLAMGYLDSGISDGRRDLSVTILGERRACRVMRRAPVDPDGLRMRR